MDKMKAVFMRANGASYDEIGDRFGISRQAAHQGVGTVLSGDPRVALIEDGKVFWHIVVDGQGRFVEVRNNAPTSC